MLLPGPPMGEAGLGPGAHVEALLPACFANELLLAPCAEQVLCF